VEDACGTMVCTVVLCYCGTVVLLIFVLCVLWPVVLWYCGTVVLWATVVLWYCGTGNDTVVL
jgi:hypothetical protein